MSKQDYQDQIDALIPKAETGEQWAEICRLEDLMMNAVDEDIEDAMGLEPVWKNFKAATQA